MMLDLNSSGYLVDIGPLSLAPQVNTKLRKRGDIYPDTGGDENGQQLGKGSKSFSDRFKGTESFSIDIPVKEPAKFKRINFAYSYGTVEDFYRRDFETVP